MKTYHKIHTVYKRDLKSKQLIEGEWSRPEFQYLAHNQWVCTEKVDGTNIRITWDGEEIGIHGKTDRAQIPEPLLDRLHNIFDEKKSLFKEQFRDATEVCLYGEGYGPKIQCGGKYREHHDFVLFDVKIHSWWLRRKDIEEIATRFTLEVVPIVTSCDLYSAIELVRSRQLKSQWGNFEPEGLVCKPQVDIFARNGERIITKIKGKDFNGR